MQGGCPASKGTLTRSDSWTVFWALIATGDDSLFCFCRQLASNGTCWQPQTTAGQHASCTHVSAAAGSSSCARANLHPTQDLLLLTAAAAFWQLPLSLSNLSSNVLAALACPCPYHFVSILLELLTAECLQVQLCSTGADLVCSGHHQQGLLTDVPLRVRCREISVPCCSRALATINKDCRRLDHAAKARLAVALTNCHLRQLGQRTFQCTPRMSLKDCTEPMADRDFGVFNEFFSNVDR